MEKQFRFLIPALLAFVICFMLTAYYNRFAADDFELMYRFRELGFEGSVSYFYHNWNTRWMAIGWLNLVFMLTNITGNLISYHLISLVLLWFAFFRLIKNFVEISVISRVITSGFIMVSFFYSCFSISDVFFWVNTSTMYLYGVIAFLFVVDSVLNKNLQVINLVILVLAAFYLGGCYEPLVFVAMVCSVVFLIYMFNKHGLKITFTPYVLKVIITLSVLMIAFAISYMGEGHTIRATFLPQTTMSFKLWVFIKAVIKMFFIYLPSKILPAFLFSFPWFLLGMWRPNSIVSITVVKKATWIFILLVMISLLPITFIMSEMGPERAWTQVSVYLVFYTSILAFYGGSVVKKKYEQYNFTKIYALISFLYVLATGIPEIIKENIYSTKYDQRMTYLQDQNRNEVNTNTIIPLDPLPEPGWLHTAEITSDQNHFTNQHLKKYLKLKFDIRTAEIKK